MTGTHEEQRRLHELRRDGWQNVFTGLGVDGRDHTMATLFGQRLMERGQIETLYEGDPLFARMVDAVPEQATRRWISATAQGMDHFGEVLLDGLEAIDAQEQCFELMRMDRLEGGSIGIIGANDGLDPALPLDLSRIESVEHINVVSRYAVTPDVVSSEASAMQAGWQEPERYLLTGSGLYVHRSRVIRLRGIPTTPRRDAGRQGWGLPIADRVASVCRQLGSAFGYFEAALKDFIQGVVTIPGLRELLMTPAGNELLSARIRMIQMTGSIFNAMVIDGDEEYERRGATLAGMSDGIIRLMDLAACVSEIPLSILFGQPPTGLSTDDQSARKTFYDSIGNKQRRVLRGPLRRIITAMLHAKKGPTKGEVPERWRFQFLPLAEPTAKEEAETNSLRAQSETTRIGDGVLTVREARSGIRNDPRSIYSLDEDYEDALDETEAVAGELEPVGVPAPQDTLPAPAPEMAPETPVANTALNGGQVAAAIDIVDRVARSGLPRSTGVTMLIEFFSLSVAQAERIMGDVGRSFVIATQAAPEAPTPAPPAAPAPEPAEA